MKTIKFLIVISSFFFIEYICPFSHKTQLLLDKLNEDFPGIERQIKIVTDLYTDIDFSRSIQKLSAYIYSDNSISQDFKEAMNLILLPDYFTQYDRLGRIDFRIDGIDTEWSQVPHEVSDEVGDSYKSRPNLDIVALNCYLDNDYNLFLMVKTKDQLPEESVVDFFIDMFGDEHYELFFQSWTGDDHKIRYKFLELTGQKRRFNIDIDYMKGKILEVKIPLSRTALSMEDINEKVRIIARVSDPKFKKSDQSIATSFFTRRTNYALYLLLYLLENDCVIKGDSITFALALANNYLYYLGDKSVREVVKSDFVSHYNLYKKILNWQIENNFNYSMDHVAVIPKIFWCDRLSKPLSYVLTESSKTTNDKLNLKIYREFVDRVDIIEKFHEIVISKDLAGTNLGQTAKSLEEYYYPISEYRTSIDNYKSWYKLGIIDKAKYDEMLMEESQGKFKRYYFGMERQIDQFQWLNYQYQNFCKDKTFIGNCGVATIVQMALYRGAGIAPVSLSWVHPEGNSAFTHNFPGYYDPIFRRWFSVQKPPSEYWLSEYNKEVRERIFYYTKPIWQYLLSNYRSTIIKDGKRSLYYNPFCQGELTDTRRITNLLTIGISDTHFKKLFLTDSTHEKGLIFNESSAPLHIKDQDGDGLADIIEGQFKTRVDYWDSDNDLYSDKWEIENGFDPLSAKSPKEEFITLDGFIEEWAKKKQASSIEDARDDSKVSENVFDISKLSASVTRGKLCVGIHYYNDVSNSKAAQHELWINTKQNDIITNYWVSGYANGTIRILVYKNKKWVKVPVSDEHCFAIARDGEYVIPLSYFENKKIIDIRYTVMSGPKSKEVRESDGTDKLILEYFYGYF